MHAAPIPTRSPPKRARRRTTRLEPDPPSGSGQETCLLIEDQHEDILEAGLKENGEREFNSFMAKIANANDIIEREALAIENPFPRHADPLPFNRASIRDMHGGICQIESSREIGASTRHQRRRLFPAQPHFIAPQISAVVIVEAQTLLCFGRHGAVLFTEKEQRLMREDDLLKNPGDEGFIHDRHA